MATLNFSDFTDNNTRIDIINSQQLEIDDQISIINDLQDISNEDKTTMINELQIVKNYSNDLKQNVEAITDQTIKTVNSSITSAKGVILDIIENYESIGISVSSKNQLRTVNSNLSMAGDIFNLFGLINECRVEGLMQGLASNIGGGIYSGLVYICTFLSPTMPNTARQIIADQTGAQMNAFIDILFDTPEEIAEANAQIDRTIDKIIENYNQTKAVIELNQQKTTIRINNNDINSIEGDINNTKSLLDTLKQTYPEINNQIEIQTPTDTYKVKPGDTISNIAKSFGLTVDDLLNANPQLHDRTSADHSFVSIKLNESINIPTPNGYKLWQETMEQSNDCFNSQFNQAETAIHIPPRTIYWDPILLDLDNDGIETTTRENGVYFDHDVNGFAENSAWVGADDGLLVRDLDSDGTIDSGRELFGNNTLLANQTLADSGYAALAA